MYNNSDKNVLLLKIDKGKLLTTSVSCEIPYEILSKNDFYQVGRVIYADVASPKPEKDQLIKQLKTSTTKMSQPALDDENYDEFSIFIRKKD